MSVLDKVKDLNLSEKELEELYLELKNKSAKEGFEKNLKSIEENRQYEGLCFKIIKRDSMGEKIDKYCMVVRAKSQNEYWVECLTFDSPCSYTENSRISKMLQPENAFGTIDFSLLSVESFPLLCTSHKTLSIASFENPEDAFDFLKSKRATVLENECNIITEEEFWKKAKEEMENLREKIKSGFFKEEFEH